MIITISIVSFNSKGNPIPGDFNEAIPLPNNFNNTSVYLKEENIIVVFDDEKANIKASYTFKNNNSNEIICHIALPFYSEPKDISLMINGKNLEYKWTRIREHANNNFHDLKRSIVFKIFFKGYEEKELRVNYNRNHVRYTSFEDYNIIHCCFNYIVWTAQYWNHSIDHAHFEFWIPEKLFDQPRDANSYFKKGSYFVCSMNFYNWTPTRGYVGVHWVQRKSTDNQDNFLRELIIISLAIIIYSEICLVLYLKRKYSKRKLKRNLLRKQHKHMVLRQKWKS